jgi:hypothetical protein
VQQNTLNLLDGFKLSDIVCVKAFIDDYRSTVEVTNICVN